MNRCISFFISMILTISISAIDYSELETIEDVIEVETFQIDSSACLNEKIQALIDRAESYLLSKNNTLALIDYNEAITLLDISAFRTDYLFRALFGQTVALYLTDNENGVQVNIDKMKNMIDNIQCRGCFHPKKEIVAKVITEIYGADQISIEACINKVNNTGRGCRYFASLAPTPKARIALFELIHQIESKAISCCKSGGLWKACIGPLLEKWVVWNNKWKVFGEPPDPQYD